jgi:glycosyltransferase involved in cell wall biosynthesis
MPTLSILMSIYNDASYVKKTIMSILENKYQDCELIIDDNLFIIFSFYFGYDYLDKD